MNTNYPDRVGVINRLSRIYNIAFLALVALFLLVLFRVIDLSAFVAGQSAVVAERYAIGITLLSIPLGLKWFSSDIKKYSVQQSSLSAEKWYARAFYRRLCVIGLVLLANILLFALWRNDNFVWMSTVLIVVFFFCRPSITQLEDMCAPDDQSKE